MIRLRTLSRGLCGGISAAANSICSLPPCGGGLGRGVVRRDNGGATCEGNRATPTPNPGEGSAPSASRGRTASTNDHTLILDPAAVMRRRKIELRPQRHDAGRVHVALAAVIVPLDVVHVHGRRDASLLIKVAQVIREIGIVDDTAQVAFEVAVVD